MMVRRPLAWLILVLALPRSAAAQNGVAALPVDQRVGAAPSIEITDAQTPELATAGCVEHFYGTRVSVGLRADWLVVPGAAYLVKPRRTVAALSTGFGSFGVDIRLKDLKSQCYGAFKSFERDSWNTFVRRKAVFIPELSFAVQPEALLLDVNRDSRIQGGFSGAFTFGIHLKWSWFDEKNFHTIVSIPLGLSVAYGGAITVDSGGSKAFTAAVPFGGYFGVRATL